VRRKNKSSTKR